MGESSGDHPFPKIKTRITRRQFLSTAAKAAATAVAIGKIDVPNLRQDEKNIGSLLTAVWELTRNTDTKYLSSIKKEEVHKVLNSIMPEKPEDGGCYMHWQGNNRVALNMDKRFYQGSMIKAVIGTYAYKLGIPFTAEEWSGLLVESNDEMQRYFLNKVLALRNQEAIPDNRRRLIREICGQFGMKNTDDEQSNLSDYEMFVNRLFDYSNVSVFSTAKARSDFLMKFLPSNYIDRYRTIGFGVAAENKGLQALGKVGILPLDTGTTTRSIFFALLDAENLSGNNVLATGACFFNNKTSNDNFIKYCQIALELADKIRQK